MLTAKRVAVVGVPFSSNVGDAVIADCLEWGLMQAAPAISVIKVDLAGRTSNTDTSESGSLKRIFSRVPRFAQPLLTFLHFGLLKRTTLQNYYEEKLRGVDSVVLGGGNIISDVQLNFPLKISIFSKAVQRSETKHNFVFSVGVGGTWSAAGRMLIRNALRRMQVRRVSTRDQRSSDLWKRYVAVNSSDLIEEVWDPGTIASELWPRQMSLRSSRLIGVGVIAESALTLDSNSLGQHEAPVTLYCDLIERALADGCDVLAFTNGSPEDEDALERLRSAMSSAVCGSRLRFAPRPREASELAEIVSSCDAIVAHRLHAIIVAHSYGLPVIAIEWDPKVRSFMAKAGRGDFTVVADASSAGAVYHAVKRSLQSPPTAAQVATMKLEARQQMARLAEAIIQ